ncbi:TPA: PAAR domain-containing protein [Providencia alcalifaciens]
MAIGYFLRVGDRTTCGGQILTGDNTFMFYGVAAAREGDMVTCGKHSGTYQILGGISNVWGNGRKMAGTLDSFSSCPCKSRIINSINDSYAKEEAPAPRSFSSASESITSPLVKTPSTSMANNLSVPVITTSRPFDNSLIKDPVNIYVMIATDGEGHVGLVVGDGKEALLYDPGGSYTGCFKRNCEDGAPTHRGSNDQFPYPMWEWEDYLAYHLEDGENVSVIEFTIPKAQAELLVQIIDEKGGGAPLFCAANVSDALKRSGGIFTQLPTVAFIRLPSTFKNELMDIYFSGREWWKLNGAY